MPKPGGGPGKLGDLYEALWTAHIALDVFEGRLQSITVEAFGDKSQGVEFHTESDSGLLHFHSVKRQKIRGDWSIRDLCDADKKTGRSILGDLFLKQTRWPDCEISFVSATGANELRELTERAQEFATVEEFRTKLTNEALLNKFNKHIVGLCNGDGDAALTALKSLYVHLRDHRGLMDDIEHRLGLMFYRVDGDALRAGDVRRMLSEHIVENLGQVFTTDRLRNLFRDAELGIRDWKLDVTVRETVESANERCRRVVETELINSTHIERSVVTDIMSSLMDRDSRGALVTASGGLGKSCVVTQCMNRLSELGTPFLCIRMDSFDPCRTTKQLGAQIDLPESPAKVLAGVANGTPSVLIVDQLDAMSLISGRHPQMWEVFEQLSGEVQAYPRMKLLLACRDFDLNHDYRLRSLAEKSNNFTTHELTLLSTDEVKASLALAKLGQIALTDAAIEILRVPFHLLLFLQGNPTSSFSTPGQLFNRFWERKRRKMEEELGREPHWNQVIDALTSSMSERQLLFAPMSVVGQWEQDAAAMASSSVLVAVAQHRQYRFFHESFFDYAFARRFCETGGDVIELLESSEQHLFLRAQVRQILEYRREDNFDRYVGDVAAIFKAPNIRFHIKRMVATRFGSLKCPTVEEWNLLAPHLHDGDLSRYIARALRDHVGWFDLLERTGVFREWLASDDARLVTTAVWYLEAPNLLKARSANIATLIAPYIERGREWTHRLLRIMSWGQAYRSPEMAAQFLKLVNLGAFDDDQNQGIGIDLWNILHEAEEESPQFCIDVLTTWFDRSLRVFDDGTWNFLDKCRVNDSHTGAVMAAKMASVAPAYFVTRILPLVKRAVLQTTMEVGGEVLDRAWTGLSNNGDPFEIADALLLSVRRGLQHLAKVDPEQCRLHCESIRSEPHKTLAYLLLRAWAENPEQFADECAEFMIADKRRLNVGYSTWSDDGEGSGESAITRHALTAISPHCSQELLSQLEDAIIGYCDDYEKSRPRWRGLSELLRLRSLDGTRISQKARLRIEELERKFPQLSDVIVQEDYLHNDTFVGSPLEESITKKMNDDQWISAMRKYDGTTDPFKGGPEELSPLLRDFARKGRKRFTALVTRLPDDVAPIYFSAILDGLGGRFVDFTPEEKESDVRDFSSVAINEYLAAVNRVHDLPNRPCGSAIVGFISKLAGNPLPTNVFDIVSFYALNDSDPNEDIWNCTGDGPKYHGGDPFAHGINCVRGQAAMCLGALLSADENRFAYLRPTLSALAEDPIVSVRTCTVNALLPLLNCERDFAVALFLKTCDGSEAIWSSPPFERFLRHASLSHYPTIRNLLQRALTSKNTKAVTNAARQIIVAELSGVDVGEDGAAIRAGSGAMRKAAADVYANNIAHDRVGNECANHLNEFINDESEDVRKEVSSSFFKIPGTKLSQYKDFVATYIESRSFETGTDWLLRSLNESTVELPAVIVRAAERVFEIAGSRGADISQREAMTAHELATLVVRQYEQTRDSNLKTTCLNLIDRMERMGYYGIAEELGKVER